MTHAPRKFTSGRLAAQIVAFSVPLIASNLLQTMFNLADVAVVGRFAGAAALGAVGSTTHLVFFFVSFLTGLGSGVNVLAARFFGADDSRALRETVHSALLVCFAAGLVVLAVGETLSRPLLSLLGTREDLAGGAALYLRIYFLGMPAMAVYDFGNAVFSAVGDTRRPLVYLSAAGVLNVALNLFFVIVLHMDTAGVALASVLSQNVSAFLILRALFRCREDYGLRKSELRLHPARARAVLALGLPAGVQSAIFSVANLFIQGGVNTFDSVVVEGNAAASNADLIIFNVMSAFYVAGASFISQNYGAGQRGRILKSYCISIAWAAGAGAVLGALLLPFGRQFLTLFTTEEPVILAGQEKLGIMAGCYWLSAFMDGSSAASRGLGRSLMPVLLTILGSCVFRVVWVYTVFAHFGTFRSLFLVYAFSWIITSVAQVWYFARCYRLQTAGMTAADG